MIMLSGFCGAAEIDLALSWTTDEFGAAQRDGTNFFRL